jgi:hypothetical protein
MDQLTYFEKVCISFIKRKAVLCFIKQFTHIMELLSFIAEESDYSSLMKN